MHRTRAETANKQKSNLLRTVSRQIADIFERRKAYRRYNRRKPELFNLRLENHHEKQQRKELHNLFNHRRNLRGRIHVVNPIEGAEERVQIRRKHAHRHACETETKHRPVFFVGAEHRDKKRRRYADVNIFYICHFPTAFLVAGSIAKIAPESKKSNQK